MLYGETRLQVEYLWYFNVLALSRGRWPEKLYIIKSGTSGGEPFIFACGWPHWSHLFFGIFTYVTGG